jgi:uncharacterized protein
MATQVTAAMVYDFVRCPHRVSLDLHGDPALRDPVSPFVQLLWERGHAFEHEVVERLSVPFTNLKVLAGDAREAATREAIRRGDPLIYGGRISTADLLGEPDLLRREGNGYVAGDIKSGAGLEGESDEEEGKPKRHYVVQLGLYTDLLESLGASAGRRPFVWDVHGDEVPYDLTSPLGARNPTTLWDVYQHVLRDVKAVVLKPGTTLPALCSTCKLCHWRTQCKSRLKKTDDLTLIPELGRAKRDVMAEQLPTVNDLAKADLSALCRRGKTVFQGIGVDSLHKFQTRARLLTDPSAGPCLTQPLQLPVADTELFFDIETDPMRDVCYLHGFVERLKGDTATERYHAFLAQAPTLDEERRAFAGALAYIRSRQPCRIYYYSRYERTWWRRLRERHPDVASEHEIEALFAPDVATDLLYDVVHGHTEWPTNDHSIKTLAVYLGFEWRDEEPSGAASIEWYHRWMESGDTAIRQRILDYNEDDCIAMRVLLDGIRQLPSL